MTPENSRSLQGLRSTPAHAPKIDMLSNEESLLIGLLPLISYAFIASITPGPNNLMLLASGINFGIRPTLPHMAGIIAGSFTLQLLSGLGAGMLFEVYPVARELLKFAGCGYMLYLAWKIANSVSMHDEKVHSAPFPFWQAAVFQYVNPKAWMMATSAASIFLTPEMSMLTGSLLIALTVSVVCIPCMSCWAFFGASLRSLLKNAHTRSIFNGGISALTAATAIWLLFE